jgi:hypothetical protein
MRARVTFGEKVTRIPSAIRLQKPFLPDEARYKGLDQEESP